MPLFDFLAGAALCIAHMVLAESSVGMPGQSKWKRMFSRKPKEKKVPEVNVLPTPVLVPPAPGAPSSPEVPPPIQEEVPTAERTTPPVGTPPTGWLGSHIWRELCSLGPQVMQLALESLTGAWYKC